MTVFEGKTKVSQNSFFASYSEIPAATTFAISNWEIAPSTVFQSRLISLSTTFLSLTGERQFAGCFHWTKSECLIKRGLWEFTYKQDATNPFMKYCMSPNYSIEGKYCFCDTDLCNAATMTMSPFLLMLFVLLLIYSYQNCLSQKIMLTSYSMRLHVE